MQKYTIDWSNIETEEEVKKALAEFRARYGILLKRPVYEEFRWCEENVEKYTEEMRMCNRMTKQRKLFYLAAKGNVGQNDRLIAAVAWLKRNHFLGKTELDRILVDYPPLLRVVVMEENEPGAGVFRERTFDLIETAIECRAKPVLERLLPYIDFDRYNREVILSILD